MGNFFSLPRVCDIFQNGSRKRKFIQQISSNDEEFDEPENKRLVGERSRMSIQDKIFIIYLVVRILCFSFACRKQKFESGK